MVQDHSLRPAPEEQVQLVQCDTPTASSRLLYARRRALAPASNTSNCSGDTAESTASSTDRLPPITDHCIKKYRATYCARNDPLPLLPSGPGGVGGITSRRTRHCSILPSPKPTAAQDVEAVGTRAGANHTSEHSTHNRFNRHP